MAMNDKKISILHIILTIIIDCALCFAMASWFAIFWARKSYPMQLHNTVFFVLKSSTNNGDSTLALSMWRGFIAPGVITFFIYRALTIFIMMRQEKWWHKKILTIKSHYIFSAVYIILIALIAAVTFKAWKYPMLAYNLNKTPVESNFYNENYVTPHVTLSKDSKRRNLVVIFMESMESTYFDTAHGGIFNETPIPRLQDLAQKNINFHNGESLGGGVNIEGTSWTAAGMLSKLSGLPYYNPFIKVDGVTKCLRKATFLTDILSDNGYKCIFSMGSNKYFENRASLFEDHHTEIHDIDYYKNTGLIPSDYKVFWGFEDLKLYKAARKELFDLGQKSLKGTPFFFGMLTVDTHFPQGFVCENCGEEIPSEPQMFRVLRCADNLVCDLIQWIGEQEWGSDTTIVIMGDHNYLNAPDNNFIAENSTLNKNDTEKARHFLDIIINPNKEIYNSELTIQAFTRAHEFSSLDMMPSILTSMGYKVENDHAGFGVSLFSDEKTLLEKYKRGTVEDALLKRTTQYDSLR